MYSFFIDDICVTKEEFMNAWLDKKIPTPALQVLFVGDSQELKIGETKFAIHAEA